MPGIVRWPGHIRAGTVSDVPVIGSDIFSTICDIADLPLPNDRVIDGATLVPVFEGQPMKRIQPLYWRTHISSPDSRVAMRIGDWKIVADESLESFQLFHLKDDPQETNDLAKEHPARFDEMRATLVAYDAEVLADGPDWWKKPQPEDRRRRAKKKKN